MRKLIDRMRASDKEILMSAACEFPFSISPVVEELERNRSYNDLTYETIGMLVSHLGLKGYGPSYISEVFPNE
jgi:hypothetical protein